VPLAWGQENGKEFVPLINLKRVLPKTHPNTSCTLFETDGKPTCTVDMLVDVLEKTKAKINTSYLMGYNEPYAGHHAVDEHGHTSAKAAKSVTGAQGAEAWRKIVQPAAQRTGLKLVSPTTGISSQKVGWLVDFLKACYDKRNEADLPCDVSLIKVFSVHEYKCYSNYWRKYAALDGGDGVTVKDPACTEKFKPRSEVNIYSAFKKAMREHYAGDAVAIEFWKGYFDEVKLWVTETSCSGDLKFDKLNKHDQVAQSPTAQQSCMDITDQSCQHRDGSIAAMLGMDNIERFSWFTLFPNPRKDHPNYVSIVAGAMVNASTEETTPVGRALINGLDADASNCNVYAAGVANN